MILYIIKKIYIHFGLSHFAATSYEPFDQQFSNNHSLNNKKKKMKQKQKQYILTDTYIFTYI
jgi:hypothetical protein